MLARAFGVGFVGSLQDSLRADVDPRTCGHLSEHHQALGGEFVELRLRGPVWNQIGVGDEHARRVLVSAHDADGLAALHQQRLVGRKPL